MTISKCDLSDEICKDPANHSGMNCYLRYVDLVEFEYGESEFAMSYEEWSDSIDQIRRDMTDPLP